MDAGDERRQCGSPLLDWPLTSTWPTRPTRLRSPVCSGRLRGLGESYNDVIPRLAGSGGPRGDAGTKMRLAGEFDRGRIATL